VGSHPGGNSPEGIVDLAGNVWEWTATADVLHPDSRGRGGAPAYVVRGGGWSDTDPRNLTAGRRAKDRPQWRLADLGFRCAKDR
jgi:formylglycine-generating enzyme required for sulfatase activity